MAVDLPPPRPRRLEDLDFEPMPAVRWFSPRVLTDAALRVGVSAAFGSYLDKRELQAVVPAQTLSHRTEAEEVWFDFVADTGDGFDATYTVAWALAQPQLAVTRATRTLPRGSLLVLGGDEVYPTASASAYRARLTQPLRASLPWVDPVSSPHGEEQVVALPGNHDWYDGLTSFIRLFCQRRWIGGRRSVQSRSYFAVALPHRWWLWGIDIALDTDLDEPQIAYFKRVLAEDMQDGDRLILCTGKPSWVDLRGDPNAYDNLAFVDRLIRSSGRAVDLAVTLTGDSHHYARYSGIRYSGTRSSDGITCHKITAGGGGAFLHPTHDLPSRILLPVDPAAGVRAEGDEENEEILTLQECYPDAATSRRLALRSVGLGWWNPTFMVITAVVYSLIAWTSQFGIRAVRPDAGPMLNDAARSFGLADLAAGLARNTSAWLVVIAFGLVLVGFAKSPPALGVSRVATAVRGAMGVVHVMAHLVASLVVTLAAVTVVGGLADGRWFSLWVVVGVAASGGVVGSVVMGAYLAVANRAGRWATHGNEAFSAQRIEDYKSFLRMHIGPDGALSIYPIAIPEAVRRWKTDPDNPDPEASWLVPAATPPRPHLIEVDGRAGPLVLPPASAP